MKQTSDSTVSAGLVKRLFLVLIPLAVLAAFWPTLRADFITWDDDANFLNNPHFRGLTWQNLRWMFTTLHMSNYQPLSWLTTCLGYALWGMNPFGYHATSLALHMLNAVLFYLVAVRLLRLAAPADDDALPPISDRRGLRRALLRFAPLARGARGLAEWPTRPAGRCVLSAGHPLPPAGLLRRGTAAALASGLRRALRGRDALQGQRHHFSLSPCCCWTSIHCAGFPRIPGSG
jgi:hypothetical protein